MSEITDPSDWIDIVCPIYGLKTDADRLLLGDVFQIEKFNLAEFKRLLRNPSRSGVLAYLRQRIPEFVVRAHDIPERYLAFPSVPVDQSRSVVEWASQFFGPLAMDLDNLFLALRLHAPGDLLRGPTWIIVNMRLVHGHQAHPLPETPMGHTFEIRCSPSTTHPEKLSWLGGEGEEDWAVPQELYELQSSELPTFGHWQQRVTQALRGSGVKEKLLVATHFYSRTYGHHWAPGQIIDLCTCLESLLLKKGGELTFRVATRAANLIGSDGQKRKEIYTDIKNFYDLRSQVVHGEVLREKEHRDLPDNVRILREYVRRIILCSLSLMVQEGFSADDYYDRLLDEMCLDDSRRAELQSRASEFLHFDARKLQ
jgi:hypothetical protein